MADVVVVGAGVIGLTSAVCVAEAGAEVRIRTAAPPQETTSRAASAMWGSSFAGPAEGVRRWAETSLSELRALAQDFGSGVRIADGTLAAAAAKRARRRSCFRASRWFVHGDHGVLGGSAEDDVWNLEPDPAIAEDIVRRCAAIEPRLAGARVVEHRVGLRPFRPTVRVEAGPLGGVRCVHNHGHGGTGVALAWRCARDVVGLV